MSSDEIRQPQPFPLATSSEQNSRTQDASANHLRSSTPTTTNNGFLPPQIMNSPYLGHPYPTDLRPQTYSRESLNSPTSVANQNIDRDNSNNSDHLSPPSNEQGSLAETNAIPIASPVRHHFTRETLLDSNAFSGYTLAYTSLPDLYTYDNATLTNMSLEEITALQTSLSSQLTDLETTIREVRSSIFVATRTRNGTTTTRKQERRPSFGARAA